MNIALYHTTLPEPGRKLGGVEVAVHRLANELARRQEDRVTVFSLTPKPGDALYEHTQLFAKKPWLHTNKVFRLTLLPLLLNGQKFDGFDVLHLHGDDWFYLRRGLSSVRTLHGSALDEARSASSLKRRLAQYCVYPLEHVSARLATVPLAVGPRTASLYRISRLANNGVDPQLFRPGRKSEAPSVLFVGTWDGRKRGSFLYDVFTKQVLPQVPDARLHMVSDYCPEHTNVVFARYPGDEDLAKLYREAWVFAYPSTYEGFGIPYVEAMASGTAVLSSPNEGASYVLDTGRYGAISEDESFGIRLVELLRDISKRRTLEERGLRRSEAFTWSAVADQHRQAYEEALTRSQGARRVRNETLLYTNGIPRQDQPHIRS